MYGVGDGFRQLLLFSSTGPASYSCVYVSDAIHELGEPLLPKGRAMSINIQNNCEDNTINRSRLIPSYFTSSGIYANFQIMAEILKRNGFFVNYYVVDGYCKQYNDPLEVGRYRYEYNMCLLLYTYFIH